MWLFNGDVAGSNRHLHSICVLKSRYLSSSSF